MISASLGGESPPALWDRVVRVSHWGIAGVVLVNEAMTRGGSAVHVWVGWTGLILLATRLVWGLIGAREARFSAFPPNPRAAVGHLADLVAGRPGHYRSHNPAGAVMVYVLWGTLALLIGTGLAMKGVNPLDAAREQSILTSGDWSNLAPADKGDNVGVFESVKKVHAILANLLLVLVGLHVAGVVLESAVMRRNLVPPMLFGGPPDQQTHKDHLGP